MHSENASTAAHATLDSAPNTMPPAKTKLVGRAFYESIGSPKMILAPMVDQSEFAWRMLTRSFMTPASSDGLLAYTPMLHARLFTQTAKFRNHHFQPTRAGLETLPSSTTSAPLSDIYLDGHPMVDRPLVVQFCANEPAELLAAAKYVQPFCDAVDLNLGCPQGIARKGNYGAFLQEDWDRVYSMINILHTKLDVPVTAKMRILETKAKTLEYAKMILSAGASIVTVHGRQRDQKGHKTGLADWSVLRYLRENLPPSTVIFANGNILQHQDIETCLRETGADGVMSAEGNLHDPTIFAKPPAPGSNDREYWRGKDGKGGYRMDAIFRRYMNILYEYVLEKPVPKRKPLFLPSDPPDTSTEAIEKPTEETDGQPPAKRQKRNNQQGKVTSPNLTAMQPHLFNLLRPLVSVHTEVRDVLARAHCGANDISAFEEVLSLVEKAVQEGLEDYEARPEKYEDPPELPPDMDSGAKREESALHGHALTQAKLDVESSDAAVRACKRPWWVCQPYVRPLPKEALAKGSLTLSRKEKLQLEEEEVAKQLGDKKPEREKVDVQDGMEEKDVPKQAMVGG